MKEAARRIVLETLGWTLVVAGIAALVLPGPGLLMLFAGMAVLSQRYTWAEKRLRPVEVQAYRAAAESVQTWPRILLSCGGALWIIATGVVWTLRPEAPEWWQLGERWWLLGGWPTGVTLIVSGVVALVLIAYSFRRFRGVEDPRAAAEAAARSN